MYTSLTPRTHNRPNNRYQQSPVWWTNEFYWYYFQEYGLVGTYRNKNGSKTTALPMPSPAWAASCKSWEPETPCTVCSLLNRLESVLSSWLSWSEPLLGSWFGSSRVFFSAWLPFLWEGLSVFINYSGRKRPSESDQFQGLSKATLSCLPSCLRRFWKDGMFQSPRSYTQHKDNVQICKVFHICNGLLL